MKSIQEGDNLMDGMTHRLWGGVSWHPLSDLPAVELTENVNILLWVPGLIVSGPPIVCYRQNKVWIVANTGDALIGKPTHFSLIDKPYN
jgi:hypothetical protein